MGDWKEGTGSKIDLFYCPGSIRTLRNVCDDFSYSGGNTDPLPFCWTYSGSGGHYEKTARAGMLRLVPNNDNSYWWNTTTNSPKIFQAVEGDFIMEATVEHVSEWANGTASLFVAKDDGNWCATGLFISGSGRVFWWTYTENFVSHYTFIYSGGPNQRFRISRVGSTFQFQFLYSGTWTTLGSVTQNWQWAYAGVYGDGKASYNQYSDIDNVYFSNTRTAAAMGSYTSKVIDLGAIPTLTGSISWSCSTFIGAVTDIKTRTSADGITWGGWSGAYATPAGSAIAPPSNRFIQFKAELYENASLDSPILNWVNISYPGIAPFAPVVTSPVFHDNQWGSGDPVNLTVTPTADSPAPIFSYYYAIDAFPVNAGVLIPSAIIMSTTIHSMSLYGLLDGGHEFNIVGQAEPSEYPLSGVTKFRILKDTVPPGSVSIVSPTHPTLDESPDDAPVFTLSATDTETTTDFIAGVSSYSYDFDMNSGTVPSAVSLSTTTPQVSFSGVADGTWWFHAKARDGAGNFGPASHYPIKISFKGKVRVAISSPTHPENAESEGNSPEFKLTLSNPDSATIVGYHYHLDQSPSTAVVTSDTFTKSEVIKFNWLTDGTWYLHAVAKNSTGTFTNTDHYGFTVKFGGKVLEEKNVHAVPSPIRSGKALIRYDLMAPALSISAEVLDGNSRRVATLSGSANPGRNEMFWDCSSVANGVYYLRIKVKRIDGKEESVFKKLPVIK